MANIVWISTLDEVRLIYKEVRTLEGKIKYLLKNRSTSELTLYECYQAKTFVQAATAAIAKIRKLKNNDTEMYKLLIVAATNLHTAIIYTSPVEGVINQMLCDLYTRVFNLLPVGCSFQAEIF